MNTPEQSVMELPPDLQRAIDAASGRPPELIDPRSGQRYVLVRSEEHQPAKPPEQPPAGVPEIPEGIRRSLAAIRRDLPELLASRWTRGRWVLYRGDERIRVHRDYRTLVREAVKRGFRRDEYMIDRIAPGAGEEEVEIEDLRRKYDFDWPPD